MPNIALQSSFELFFSTKNQEVESLCLSTMKRHCNDDPDFDLLQYPADQHRSVLLLHSAYLLGEIEAYEDAMTKLLIQIGLNVPDIGCQCCLCTGLDHPQLWADIN